jgi:acyl-CoA thioesterase FadM
MNLYLRLFWLLLTYRFKPKLAFGETLIQHRRTWPSDIDINGHMNNGRYLTIVDLATIEMFLRTGLLFKIFKIGWRPMSGGAIITYRRGLLPMSTYELHFTLDSRDGRWNYFKFEFVQGGKTAALGFFKAALVGRSGWITNTEADAQFGVTNGVQSLSPAVKDWMAADEKLSQLIQ